ncbi:beta-lactamase family protein [Rhodococcus sp. HNM0569]|nr:serine hydrolase domain-containing protein [Rhodococcus sp. HNM0569]NLU81392.1 beta-lactamase family protein [Rhodococcus sp. HNM0569]
MKCARRLAVVASLAILTVGVLGATALAFARDQTISVLVAAPSGTSSTIVTVEDKVWTAGVRDPASTEPVSGTEHFRIGSITKTFVATVLLQLVDEGKITLDNPVENYLPGAVRGGEEITVRQVLQHTSGLPDYMKAAGWSTNRWRGEGRYRDYSPDDLLHQAFTRPPDFLPGESFRYSNTNYIVAGLLIEAITGQAYGTEIKQRILQPLDLAGTSIPGSDPQLPEPSIRAVLELDDGSRVDVTEQNETLDWAAGEMISTSTDLTTFLDALLGGRLLTAPTLAEMRTTVPMGMGFHYGLGLERFDLPCGGQLWGHGGQLLGYVTYAYHRDDGHTLTLLRASGNDDSFLGFAAIATAAYCFASP